MPKETGAGHQRSAAGPLVPKEPDPAVEVVVEAKMNKTPWPNPGAPFISSIQTSPTVFSMLSVPEGSRCIFLPFLNNVPSIVTGCCVLCADTAMEYCSLDSFTRMFLAFPLEISLMVISPSSSSGSRCNLVTNPKIS